jgi:hypothetical protein
MIKRFILAAIVSIIVTFLLYAFAWWNINPAMWSESGRIGFSVAIAIEILVIILICVSMSDL